MAFEGKSLESVKNEDKVKVCPDCGSKDLDFDKGENFCKRCGLVLE